MSAARNLRHLSLNLIPLLCAIFLVACSSDHGSSQAAYATAAATSFDRATCTFRGHYDCRIANGLENVNLKFKQTRFDVMVDYNGLQLRADGAQREVRNSYGTAITYSVQCANEVMTIETASRGGHHLITNLVLTANQGINLSGVAAATTDGGTVQETGVCIRD